MKTKFYYFLALICMALVTFTSCEKLDFELEDGNGVHGATASGTVNHDTIVTPSDPIVITCWSDKDTVIIHADTVYIYRDSTQTITPYNPVESYVLGSNKVDNGTNYVDVQPTSYLIDGEVMLNTDVNRSADISNEVDTFFLASVPALRSNVSRPTTNSSYDVRGGYDINTGYRDYTVTFNDGSEYKVNTETESASGMYEGSKKDLLYRMVQGVSVVSVNDQMTNDTVVRNSKIYRRANRTVQVEVKSLNRPLMGPEVITLDTLTISSVAATKTNGIAVVFIEDGDVPQDTIPVIPDTIPVIPDTIPVTPPDTITPDPHDTIPTTPDDGYTINGEKIKSITFSYAIDPNAGILREILLVRTASYVMPVVSKQKKAAVAVANPNDYNSAVWYANTWRPAYLAIHEQGFVWYDDAQAAQSGQQPRESSTEDHINWLANSSHIGKISRSDFLKEATFVNEGTTTRVYVDAKYYMTLQ